MRPTILLLAFGLAWCVPGLSAADASEVKTRFEEAFTKGEAADKKEALRLAQSLSKDQDDLAYELLVRGVNDRQVHDEAVMALRARTGLQPTLLNRGNGYPGYPASDDASEWNNWLAQRKKDKETQKKIAEQEQKLKEMEAAEKEGKGKDGKGASGDKPAGDKPVDGEKPADPTIAADENEKPAYEPPSDLGRLDRIVFKTGGSLVCYVLSKRVNADGVLQSVRIVHQNNGGEEILSADLIARIDEDIR
jgi:hypothetical protein